MQKQIFPIVAYGSPVLRKKATEMSPDTPHLQQLIANMFETMYGAGGVGLAAPQIGISLRIFVIDASPFSKEEDGLADFKEVFINPTIIEESGEPWGFEEGCLSIPKIKESVYRKPIIKVRYQDADFNSHEKTLDGLAARVFQHEYDHLEGILFIDKLKPLKRRLLKKKLNNIMLGNIDTEYPMKFKK